MSVNSLQTQRERDDGKQLTLYTAFSLVNQEQCHHMEKPTLGGGVEGPPTPKFRARTTLQLTLVDFPPVLLSA